MKQEKLYKVWDENGRLLFDVNRATVDFIKTKVRGKIDKHPFGFTVFKVEFSTAIRINGNDGKVRLYLFDQYMVQLDKDEK